MCTDEKLSRSTLTLEQPYWFLCPISSPLPCLLESRSAAPVAAVERPVTAEQGKVKQFWFQEPSIPLAVAVRTAEPRCRGLRVQGGQAGSRERNHHSCARVSLLLGNASPESLPRAAPIVVPHWHRAGLSPHRSSCPRPRELPAREPSAVTEPVCFTGLLLRTATASGAQSWAGPALRCARGDGSPRGSLTCGRSVPLLPGRRGSRRWWGINSALPSVNLRSTCSLHSRHFVTRTLPARVVSLTRRWHTRQLGSELNLGYPQGTGSCFVRPAWSNKGSWKSALRNPLPAFGLEMYH